MHNWERKYPGAKVIIGMDANPWLPLVGPMAAGERCVDEKRAESFYGFFQRHALKAVSTYWHSEPTRKGLGDKEEEASAQIDVLLATEHLAFWGKTRSDLYATLSSDHLLLGMVVSHVPKDATARKEYFQSLLQPQAQVCLPKTWQPRDEKVYRQMLRYDKRDDLCQEMIRIRQIATSEMKWQDVSTNPYLRRLWKGLRKAECTLLRRAYQLLIREEQKRI